MKTLRIVVSGKVQGVFFRAYTKECAERFSIAGSVRNLGTGEVEIIAEGEDTTMSEFVAAVRKGPKAAHVKKIQIIEIKTQFFGDFRIVR